MTTINLNIIQNKLILIQRNKLIIVQRNKLILKHILKTWLLHRKNLPVH